MQSIKITVNILLRSWPLTFGVLICVLFFAIPIIGFDFTYYPGDLIDARFINYILEHCYSFFCGNEAAFWDAGFMYPEENVVSYSVNLIGTSIFYILFRLSGFEYDTSFQLWFVFNTLASFIATYFFLKWQFKSNYAAVVGALVFSISLALQSQITHGQTFTRFPIVLSVWMCLLFSKKLELKYFFLAQLFLVYQFYCSIYLGVFLCALVGTMLITIFLVNHQKIYSQIQSIKWITGMIATLLVNGILLYALLIPYFKRSGSILQNTYHQVMVTIPQPVSYFTSKPGSLLWDSISVNRITDDPNFWDHTLFAGSVSTICFVFFQLFILLKLIKPQLFKKLKLDKSLLVLGISSVVIYSIFTRFGQYSLYQYLFELPGFNAIRSVGRIINIQLIFLAFGTAFVFKVLQTYFNKYIIPVFLLMTGLIVADNYLHAGSSYRSEKEIAHKRVETLVQKVNALPKGAVFSYEPTIIEWLPMPYHIDAMIAAKLLELKTINGYTSTTPWDYHDYYMNLDEKGRNFWLENRNVKQNSVFVVN